MRKQSTAYKFHAGGEFRNTARTHASLGTDRSAAIIVSPYVSMYHEASLHPTPLE